MFQSGLYVQKSGEKANKLLRKSADLGNEDAQ